MSPALQVRVESVGGGSGVGCGVSPLSAWVTGGTSRNSGGGRNGVPGRVLVSFGLGDRFGWKKDADEPESKEMTQTVPSFLFVSCGGRSWRPGDGPTRSQLQRPTLVTTHVHNSRLYNVPRPQRPTSQRPTSTTSDSTTSQSTLVVSS